MSEMDRFDRELQTWLGGPLDRLPEPVLEATFAATSRTRQRPAMLAIAAGTPSMAGGPAAAIPARAMLVAVLALLLLGTLVVVVGRLLEDRQPVLVVAPSPAPSLPVEPDPSAAPTTGFGPGSVFLVPGTLAEFSATLPTDWQRARDDESPDSGLRINVAYELLPSSFDHTPSAWLVVTATAASFETVRAEMAEDGWTDEVEVIDGRGLEGVILADPDSSLDPTAVLVAHGITYRVAAHAEPWSRGLFFLRTFLATFVPLGEASGAETYVDEAWRFAFVPDAAGHPGFRAPEELAADVTRFPAASCAPEDVAACPEYVDVIRLPNTSPLHLTLPDGRAVALAIDPQSTEYARLAAEWESIVGRSRGSSAFELQGVVVFSVDDGDFRARFVHRGEQWLVILASEGVSRSTDLSEAFLAGFSLLP
jgi:hypothetical protein